jgi:hypothetical protein
MYSVGKYPIYMGYQMIWKYWLWIH